MRVEKKKRKDLRTEDLLVPGITVRRLADLVNLEPLGRRTVELVACRGVTRSHISHHWAGIMRPL